MTRRSSIYLLAFLLSVGLLAASDPAQAQDCNKLLHNLSLWVPEPAKNFWATLTRNKDHLRRQVIAELEDESDNEMVEEMLSLSVAVDPNLSPEEQMIAIEDGRIQAYKENYVEAGYYQLYQIRTGQIPKSTPKLRFRLSADFMAREMGRWLWQHRNTLRLQRDSAGSTAQEDELSDRIQKIDHAFVEFPPEEMFRE